MCVYMQYNISNNVAHMVEKQLTKKMIL